MIIYADELLLKNFIMSFFILLIVRNVLSIKCKKRDLIIGSFVCSLLTLFAYIYEIEKSFFARMITITLMVYISFRDKKIENILIEIAFVLGITFLIGGVLSSNIENHFELIICGVIALIAFKMYNGFYKQKKWKLRNEYKLNFKIDNTIVETIVILDTGNFLTTNFNEPVIILSKDVLKGIIPDSAFKLLLEGQTKDINTLKNLRIINYKVVNEKSKIAYGLKVENIKIKNEECEIIRDAVIMLSQNNIKESSGIIGMNLLEGGMNSGDVFDFKAKSKEIVC